MPREYRNMLTACKRMLLEDGPRSFFDGLGLRMARKAMSSALAWPLYEELLRRPGLPINSENRAEGARVD